MSHFLRLLSRALKQKAVTVAVHRDAGAREPKSPQDGSGLSSDQAGTIRISPTPSLEAPPEAQAAEASVANSSTPSPRPRAGSRGRAAATRGLHQACAHAGGSSWPVWGDGEVAERHAEPLQPRPAVGRTVPFMAGTA